MSSARFKPTLRLLLTAAMQESGLQQREIAQRVGCSAQTITAWLRGHREPTVSQLMAYSQATSCRWLLDLNVIADQYQDPRGDVYTSEQGGVTLGCKTISPGQGPVFANEDPSWN